jgi:4-amino-4-deoxy-L-arabinose transferase-like glycosyltransferase
MKFNASFAFRALWLCSVLGVTAVVFVSGHALRYPDEREYFELAQHLASGLGYVGPDLQPTAYRPPGYPFLMSLFAGHDGAVMCIKFLNVALIGTSLWLMRLLAHEVTPKLSWLAGGAALAYPVWVYTASTLYPQTLCMTMLLALVWMLSRTSADWRWPVGAGALAGLLILVAPSFLLLMPLWCAFTVLGQGQDWRRGLSRAICLAVVAMAVLSPWIVRNHGVFGQFVPVATNGGINLLLGNSPYTGPNTGVNVPWEIYMKDIPADANEVQVSAALQAVAVDWVRHHPVDAAVLYVGKALNYYNFRSELAIREHAAVWKDVLMAVTYYPLLLLVAVRLAFWRQRPVSRLEGMLLLAYVVNGLLAAIFFTRIRFRLPFDGLLMVLAISSLGQLHGLWRARRQAVSV